MFVSVFNQANVMKGLRNKLFYESDKTHLMQWKLSWKLDSGFAPFPLKVPKSKKNHTPWPSLECSEYTTIWRFEICTHTYAKEYIRVVFSVHYNWLFFEGWPGDLFSATFCEEVRRRRPLARPSRGPNLTHDIFTPWQVWIQIHKYNCQYKYKYKTPR